MSPNGFVWTYAARLCFLLPLFTFQGMFFYHVRPLQFAFASANDYRRTIGTSISTNIGTSYRNVIIWLAHHGFILFFPLNHSKTLFSCHDFGFSIWCSLFGVNDFVYLILRIIFCVHYVALFQKWQAFPLLLNINRRHFVWPRPLVPPPIRPPKIISKMAGVSFVFQY